MKWKINNNGKRLLYTESAFDAIARGYLNVDEVVEDEEVRLQIHEAWAVLKKFEICLWKAGMVERG